MGIFQCFLRFCFLIFSRIRRQIFHCLFGFLQIICQFLRVLCCRWTVYRTICIAGNFTRIHIKLHGAGQVVGCFNNCFCAFAVDEVHSIVRFHKVASFAVVLQVPTRIQHVGNRCRIVTGKFIALRIQQLSCLSCRNRCRLVVFVVNYLARNIFGILICVIYRRQIRFHITQCRRCANGIRCRSRINHIRC